MLGKQNRANGDIAHSHDHTGHGVERHEEWTLCLRRFPQRFWDLYVDLWRNSIRYDRFFHE